MLVAVVTAYTCCISQNPSLRADAGVTAGRKTSIAAYSCNQCGAKHKSVQLWCHTPRLVEGYQLPVACRSRPVRNLADSSCRRDLVGDHCTTLDKQRRLNDVLNGFQSVDAHGQSHLRQQHACMHACSKASAGVCCLNTSNLVLNLGASCFV